MKSNDISRRQFLAATVGTIGALALTGCKAKDTGPNRRFNYRCIWNLSNDQRN